MIFDIFLSLHQCATIGIIPPQKRKVYCTFTLLLFVIDVYRREKERKLVKHGHGEARSRSRERHRQTERKDERFKMRKQQSPEPRN